MKGLYTYKLEALTPVHIGNGQKLLPSDYVIDRAESKVVRVNLPEMFRDRGFPFQRYIGAVKQPGFTLGNDYTRAGLQHPLYHLQAGENLNELVRVGGRPASFILEHIKETGKPYIPGSSIKGALRSVLLRHLLGEYAEIYEQGVKTQIQRHYERRQRKEFFSIPAEQRVLGDPNHSLLRILQVSDSSVIEGTKLSLGCVKILSLSRQGYRWKVLGSENNLDSYEDATPIFFEALPAKSELYGRIKIDASLCEKSILHALGWNQNKVDAITDLTAICLKDSFGLLQFEHAFFSRIDFKPGLDSIRRLKQQLETCGSNEAIFPISWGGGYLAKATGWKVDNKVMEEILNIREFGMGRNSFEFPKSRKISFSFGEPHDLLGWVKLTLEEI